MKLICAAVACVLLCSCSVWMIVPNPRVEPPELRGDHGIKVGGEVGDAHSYTATPDGSARPPDLKDPSLGPTLDSNATFLYSPSGDLEYGVEAHPLSLGLTGVVKYQALGQGTRTAEAGNVSLGFYGRSGVNYGQSSGDQSTLFGPGGYAWKGTVSGLFIHSGFSVGYRTNKHMMVYAGGALGQYWNRTEIDQGASGTDPGGVYKTNDTGNGRTAGAGMLFNWHIVQFYLTGEYSHISYTHAGIQDGLNVAGGFYFTPR